MGTDTNVTHGSSAADSPMTARGRFEPTPADVPRRPPTAPGLWLWLWLRLWLWFGLVPVELGQACRADPDPGRGEDGEDGLWGWVSGVAVRSTAFRSCAALTNGARLAAAGTEEEAEEEEEEEEEVVVAAPGLAPAPAPAPAPLAPPAPPPPTSAPPSASPSEWPELPDQWGWSSM